MAFDLACPCCGAKLKIDPTLETVLSHEAPKIPRKFGTVDDAMVALKQADVEREEKFASAVEAEKKKKEVLNAKFEDLFEKAKADKTRPIRDFDLD
jgi:hypothetical protein